jgi:hypothetical protein
LPSPFDKHRVDGPNSGHQVGNLIIRIADLAPGLNV